MSKMEAGTAPQMGRARRLLALATLSIALGAAGLGCGSSHGGTGGRGASAGAAPGARATLTIGLSTAPVSLDPARDGIDYFSVMVRPLANETILHLSPDGTFTPGLATSWRFVGSGNRTFELNLRHDARFSDGSPVTAQAVKAWLEYMVHANGPLAASIGRIASIETIGQWTVRLHLGIPNPIVDRMLTELYNWGQVAGPKALAKPSTLGTATDGAGPYTLAPGETVAGDHYTFVPNRYYYDRSRIRFSRIVVRIIPSAASMLAAVKAGQVDVAVGDPETAAAAASSGVDIHTAPSGKTATVFFVDRTGKVSKPLGDPRVRQALNYAVDRGAIARGLLGKYGTPTSVLLTPDGDPQATLRNAYSYDPAKARALLAAAGYPNGFSFKAACGTFQGAVGCTLTQAVAKYLKAVGVTMQITQDANLSGFVQHLLGGQFAAIETGTYGGPATTAWYVYGDTVAPNAVWNPGRADDPTATALFRKGAVSSDPAIWEQLMRRTVAQGDFLPVAETAALYYVSKQVGGVSPTAASVYALPSEWFPK